jgi:AAA domain
VTADGRPVPGGRGVAPPQSAAERAPLNILGFENLGDLLEAPPPSTPYLVEPLLTTESLGALVGPAKSGKTWALLDFLVGVSTGAAVLGAFKVGRPGPVVAVFPEGGRHLIRARVAAVLQFVGADAGDVQLVWVRPRGLALTDRSAVAELRDAVRKTGAVLVLLDSVFLLLPGVRTSALNEIGAVLQGLTDITSEFGCAVLIGHHTNRIEGASGVYKATGAGVAEWASSFLLATSGAKNTVGGVTTWALRFELTARDLPELAFTSTFSVGREDPTDPASAMSYHVATRLDGGPDGREELPFLERRVLEALQILGEPGGTLTQIDDVLARTGKPLRHERLREVLGELVEADLAGAAEDVWWASGAVSQMGQHGEISW